MAGWNPRCRSGEGGGGGVHQDPMEPQEQQGVDDGLVGMGSQIG